MKKILFLTVISLTLFSCENVTPPDGPMDDTVSVSLSLTVAPSVSVGVTTEQLGLSPSLKSLVDPILAENKIYNLWVLQFEANPTAEGESAQLLTKTFLKFSTALDLSQTEGVVGSLNLAMGDSHQLYYIANTYEDLFVTANIKVLPVAEAYVAYTLADFLDGSINATNLTNVTGTIPTGGIPMIGKSTVAAIDKTTIRIPVSNEVEQIVMKRLYSKVVFTYTIADVMTGFIVKNISLRNSPLAFPLAAVFHDSTDDLPSTNVDPGKCSSSKIAVIGIVDDATPLTEKGKATFYLPQNLGGIYTSRANIKHLDGKNKSGVAIYTDGEKLSYIVLEASYDAKTYYYKYYIGTNVDGFDDYRVISNNIYNMTTDIMFEGTDAQDNIKNIDFIP